METPVSVVEIKTPVFILDNLTHSDHDQVDAVADPAALDSDHVGSCLH